MREDPATGNAAAFLGAWLLEQRVCGQSEVDLAIEQGHELDLAIEQGHELGRPSLVRLRAANVEESRA